MRARSSLDPAGTRLAALQEAIESVVGQSLLALYVFGSYARVGFDPHISDLDLIAVLSEPPGRQLAARLDRMHKDLAKAKPDWDDRIEVNYISKQGLANCLTETTTIGVISPGEPFHLVQAGREWVLNWYPARERSLKLTGPPIEKLIPPIPTAEYIDELRRYLADFTNRIDDNATLAWQAYAILSICRGLYTLSVRRSVSKREGASWAEQEFPEWADLIRRAVQWRDRQRDAARQDGSTTVVETRRFVTEMARLILE